MEESREMEKKMEDETHGFQPFDYLQVAKLLQEQLDDFLKSNGGELPRARLRCLLKNGGGEFPGKRLRWLLDMAASHTVVTYAVMNPVIWGRLPRGLLELVLARLPVQEITGLLRCQFFEEWTMNMQFCRACDEVNPNMAALISHSGGPLFTVRILDCSRYVWLYCYGLCMNGGNAPRASPNAWNPMASDGGLVCFVSTWNYTEANPLCIVVINPLTRVQHELPPLQHVYTVPPTLVHMKVDSEAKAYKVVVVVNNEGRHTVETYDSASRQWSRAGPSWGRILGRACEWKIRDRFDLKCSSLCASDFEEGRLEPFDSNLVFQSDGACVKQFALVGDRVFVLHRKENQHDVGSAFFFITEFQFQNGAEVWVPMRTHSQSFPDEQHWSVDLHACEDVLMLRRRFFDTAESFHFLNFSTSEWHKFLPKEWREQKDVSPMCRVFWNVIP